MMGAQALRALVAAHDRWTRERVAHILVEAGLEVHQASNGVAALRTAEREQPRVVLMAHDLAEISPAEVAASLRADARTRHAALVELDDVSNATAIDVLSAVLNALETRQEDAAAAPMRSVSASPWGTWPLASVALSHSTSRIRNAGRSGKWRLSSGIETL